MAYPQNDGKPIFHEFQTPIGLFAHCYHDKPQLKTTDSGTGGSKGTPIMDKEFPLIQAAEFKATLAWSKTRMAELQAMIDLAHVVKSEAWPASNTPGAFFALEPFFRDGDNPAHNTKNKEYLRNRYYLNFKQRALPVLDPQTKQFMGYTGAPGLLGPYGPTDLIMPVDAYAGMTGRVSAIMFGTEYAGKNFISVRLNNIQKYEDGDRIGGGIKPTAAEQFGALKAGDGLGVNPQASPFGALGSALTTQSRNVL